MNIKNNRQDSITVEFPNDIKLSCIWGALTHTDNNDEMDFTKKCDSSDMEIMVFGSKDFIKEVSEKYDEFFEPEVNLLNYFPLEKWIDLLAMCKDYVPKDKESL